MSTCFERLTTSLMFLFVVKTVLSIVIEAHNHFGLLLFTNILLADDSVSPPPRPMTPGA